VVVEAHLLHPARSKARMAVAHEHQPQDLVRSAGAHLPEQLSSHFITITGAVLLLPVLQGIHTYDVAPCHACCTHSTSTHRATPFLLLHTLTSTACCRIRW
jgi:hypothetical protein